MISNGLLEQPIPATIVKTSTTEFRWPGLTFWRSTRQRLRGASIPTTWALRVKSTLAKFVTNKSNTILTTSGRTHWTGIGWKYTNTEQVTRQILKGQEWTQASKSQRTQWFQKILQERKPFRKRCKVFWIKSEQKLPMLWLQADLP